MRIVKFVSLALVLMLTLSVPAFAGSEVQLSVSVIPLGGPGGSSGPGAPPDLTPPIIYDIVLDVSKTAATVYWKTNEPSTSRVLYRLGSTSKDRVGVAYVTSHGVQLVDLIPGSTYHYRLESADPSGNLATTVEASFTTLSEESLVAAFSVSNLSILPDVVGPNEEVRIEVLAKNTGPIAGSYFVELRIDGQLFGAKAVTLVVGGKQRVRFAVSKELIGSYLVDVNSLQGSFEVREPIVPPNFVVSSMIVEPEVVEPLEDVTISVLVTNHGGSEGTYLAILKVGGETEANWEVTLAVGSSQLVTFTVSKQAPGPYIVEVDGQVGLFNVVEPIIEPILPEPDIEEPNGDLLLIGAFPWGVVIGSLVGSILIVGTIVWVVRKWLIRNQEGA